MMTSASFSHLLYNVKTQYNLCQLFSHLLLQHLGTIVVFDISDVSYHIPLQLKYNGVSKIAESSFRFVKRKMILGTETKRLPNLMIGFDVPSM